MNLEMIAHRGFSAVAPENTLVAFEAAVRRGANSIEFDVQITADGIPVIFHDPTLDRITGTPGTVREKTLAELQQLDAGAWFAERYAGATIPTLEETLAGLKDINGLLYFDIKPHAQWSDEELETLLGTVEAAKLGDRTILTCFDEEFLTRCRQRSPQIQVGYFMLTNDDFSQQLETAVAAGNAILSSEYHVILEHPEIAETSRDRGVDVVVWTVDDRRDFQQLAAAGIRRIVTNSLIGSDIIKN
ncbi:MAG: glycerophosphodiester phosphodiesterase [Limnospira sp.]